MKCFTDNYFRDIVNARTDDIDLTTTEFPDYSSSRFESTYRRSSSESEHSDISNIRSKFNDDECRKMYQSCNNRECKVRNDERGEHYCGHKIDTAFHCEYDTCKNLKCKNWHESITKREQLGFSDRWYQRMDSSDQEDLLASGSACRNPSGNFDLPNCFVENNSGLVVLSSHGCTRYASLPFCASNLINPIVEGIKNNHLNGYDSGYNNKNHKNIGSGYRHNFYDRKSNCRGNYDYTGRNFEGTRLTRSDSGRNCRFWNEVLLTNENKYKYTIALEKTGGTRHNACRNPDNDPNGPWCFVKEFYVGGSIRNYESCGNGFNNLPVCLQNGYQFTKKET